MRCIFFNGSSILVIRSFWKLSERSFSVNGWVDEISLSAAGGLYEDWHFGRETRKKQSYLKYKGAKRPYLLASLLLEQEESSSRWATGAHGRATRATCVRGIFILEEKLNGVRGGNTDVAALPIEHRGGVYADPCAIEANLP